MSMTKQATMIFDLLVQGKQKKDIKIASKPTKNRVYKIWLYTKVVDELMKDIATDRYRFSLQEIQNWHSELKRREKPFLSK